jgi:hypothetical protein
MHQEKSGNPEGKPLSTTTIDLPFLIQRKKLPTKLIFSPCPEYKIWLPTSLSKDSLSKEYLSKKFEQFSVGNMFRSQ